MGRAERMGEGNAFKFLVWKPQDAKPLDRPRRWWDNIKVDL
jgi:hypothetical protein